MQIIVFILYLFFLLVCCVFPVSFLPIDILKPIPQNIINQEEKKIYHFDSNIIEI